MVGELFHYALVIAFAGGAVVIFCFLWWRGRLDMDESPKDQLFLEDD